MRTSNPVYLLRLNSVNKINVFQIINQAVGIFCNGNHPLFFVFAYHFGPAAFATPVDDFFVCQADFTGRTPVDCNFRFVGQPLFIKFQEHPLRPFVIFRVAGIEASVPVERKTDGFQLTCKVGNVRFGRNCRMNAGFYRVIFRWQTKRVKPHRIQNIQSLHTLFACNDVQGRVRAGMPDMEACAGRVRKFHQSIKFLFFRVDIYFVCFLIFPDFLPFALNCFKIIAFFQLPVFFPFFKRGFSVISGIFYHF